MKVTVVSWSGQEVDGRELLERMAEDNEKMERSAECEGHFGKENLIQDGAFSLESKYHLCLLKSIPAILGIEILILHGGLQNYAFRLSW
ncbi:unnamed protein product [Malus baccata var. baccata]